MSGVHCITWLRVWWKKPDSLPLATLWERMGGKVCSKHLHHNFKRTAWPWKGRFFKADPEIRKQWMLSFFFEGFCCNSLVDLKSGCWWSCLLFSSTLSSRGHHKGEWVLRDRWGLEPASTWCCYVNKVCCARGSWVFVFSHRRHFIDLQPKNIRKFWSTSNRRKVTTTEPSVFFLFKC